MASEQDIQAAAAKGSQVNIFHGGLSLHNDSDAKKDEGPEMAISDRSHVVRLIDEYVERVKGYIQNHGSDSASTSGNRLDLSEICMDRLVDSSAIEEPSRSHVEVARAYSLHSQLQTGPQATMALARAGGSPALAPSESRRTNEMEVALLHMELKLERLMTETFREFRKQRLLQGFQSQNKKALKKKLKKKLQKEQEEERERQRQEELKRSEAEKARKSKLQESTSDEEGHIRVNNSAAVQLLLGQDSLGPASLQEARKGEPTLDATKPALKRPKAQQGANHKNEQATSRESRTKNNQAQNLHGGGAQIQQTEKQVDPFNYFQVLDHQKQSAHAHAAAGTDAANSKNEDGQRLSNSQRRPAQASAAAAPGGSSHCGTTKTISTCDESKQVEQSALAAGAHAAPRDDQEPAMSNQDFLARQLRAQRREGQAVGAVAAGQNGEKMTAVSSHLNQGNALFKTKHWQRKDNTKAAKVLDEIVGELMSESSSTQGRSGANRRNFARYEMIDLKVKGNKVHARQSDLASDQDCSDQGAAHSSQSSRKETNQIITFKKPHVRRVVPKPGPRSSSSSNGQSSQSETDSDQDLLPDVYAKFDPQPHDNDSSDYGAEEPPDEADILNTVEDEEPDAESLADDSSMAYEKSARDPGLLTSSAFKKQYGKTSDKKSIQTAYPKIEGQLVKLEQQKGKGSKRQGARKKIKKNKIDFYEHDKVGESGGEDEDQAPQVHLIKTRVLKLPTLPTLTIQLIELDSKEYTTRGEVKTNNQPTGKNKHKKSKKQRQQLYLNNLNMKSDQEEVQAKQIQIIMPEIIKPAKEPPIPSKKGKGGDQAKDKQGSDAAAINEKRKKKKAGEQVDAMNSFISKLQGNSSVKDEMNKQADVPIQAGQQPASKKAKKEVNIQKQEAHPIAAESTKSISKVSIDSPSKAPQAPGTADSSSQQHAQTRTSTKKATTKTQETQMIKKRDAPEDQQENPQQTHEQESASQKNIEKKTKVSEKDKKRESTDKATPSEKQTTPKEAQEGKKQEVKKIASQERPAIEKEKPAAFNMNSQEFRLQKKPSLVLPQRQESMSKDVSGANAVQSPIKTFKSLQEALEYNQSSTQETTLSAKAAKGKKGKNQANKNVAKEQQIQDKTEAQKALQSINHEHSAKGAKDLASDKSQSSQPKKKKKRRTKDPKAEPPMNLQLQQSWIDPTTGETMFMDSFGTVHSSGFGPGQLPGPFGMVGSDGMPMSHDGFMGQQPTAFQLQQQLQQMTQQMQQTTGSQPFSPFNTATQHPGFLMGGSLGQPMMGPPQMGALGQPNIGHQVQELLYKIQEQYMARQQMQMAEIQRRQQEEEEMQLMDDCEPCPEIDDVRYDQFFEELGEEMRAKVKEIDMLKDSVRKERQGFISIVESIVKETFSNRFGNGYVGIKIFGSMATELAIETSDVDLVVTGINAVQGHGLGGSSKDSFGPKEHVLKIMQKLYDNLVGLKSTGQIQKIKFIQGATVPIIKLVADLEAISQRQTEKAVAAARKEWEEKQGKPQGGKAARPKGNMPKWEDVSLKDLGIEPHEVDPSMRYLQVDISIDEQSDQMEATRQYSQMGAGANPSPASGAQLDTQQSSGPGLTPAGQVSRTHSGIDTIYHIQELVRARKDLRPIVMIIKKIFDQTYLSMPYYGGLSSFSLVLMVSAYLKRFDEKNTESLSRNLSGFFHFYGCGFKPHLHYLNGDNIEYEENKRPFPDPFIVLDPMDLSNNVGHSTFRIKDIQRALVQAFKIINQSCEEYQLIDEAALEAKAGDGSRIPCLPKNVLGRLLTEIREQHYQHGVWTDDDV